MDKNISLSDLNDEIENINALDRISEKERSRLDLKAYMRMLRKKTPFHIEFLQKLNSGGSSFVLADKTFSHTIKPLTQAAKGFQMAGLALSAMEFFEIPLLYLEAWIWGEKVPFTLRNNARWAYTAVILALLVASFAVPAIALPIWATVACLAVGETVVTLGDMWKRYRELPDEIEALKSVINEEMTDVRRMMSEIKPDAAPEKINELHRKLSALHELKRDLLQKQAEQQQLSPKTVMDKGMRVVFASLSLVGMIIFVFAPPVGGIFLATVAGLALSYALGRIVQDTVWPKIQSYIDTKRLENTFEEFEDDAPKTEPLNFLGYHREPSSTARISSAIGALDTAKRPEQSDKVTGVSYHDAKQDSQDETTPQQEESPPIAIEPKIG